MGQERARVDIGTFIRACCADCRGFECQSRVSGRGRPLPQHVLAPTGNTRREEDLVLCGVQKRNNSRRARATRSALGVQNHHMRRLSLALMFVALLVMPTATDARSAARPVWWWTPEYATFALQQAPRLATSAACAGVGVSRFRLKAAMSVSPNGALGYGSNLAAITTQVPKYSRFRCVARFPKSGRWQGWLVVDLIPRGPGLNQLTLVPTRGFRSIDRATEYR